MPSSKVAALALAQRILQAPPSTLSTLEALVGPLEVNFAGGEAVIGLFFRPPIRAFNFLSRSVAPGLESLSVRHAWDMHHEDPYRHRDLGLTEVKYTLAVPSSDLEALLTQTFGPGRTFTHPKQSESWLEYGPFYLRTEPTRTGELVWHAIRPEWAVPRVDASVRRALLGCLVEALLAETTETAVFARLEPHLAVSGAKAEYPVTRHRNGIRSSISLVFTPLLSLHDMLDVFGWKHAVAHATSTHKDSWAVLPDVHHTATGCHIGTWGVRATFYGWPHGPNGEDLPQAPRHRVRYYDLFELAHCDNDIAHMTLVPGPYSY
jgi:hypothetical protein